MAMRLDFGRLDNPGRSASGRHPPATDASMPNSFGFGGQNITLVVRRFVA